MGAASGAQDVRVGDEDKKGISGGQMRRLSLGVGLLKDPKVVFLAQPIEAKQTAVKTHSQLTNTITTSSTPVVLQRSFPDLPFLCINRFFLRMCKFSVSQGLIFLRDQFFWPSHLFPNSACQDPPRFFYTARDQKPMLGKTLPELAMTLKLGNGLNLFDSFVFTPKIYDHETVQPQGSRDHCFPQAARDEPTSGLDSTSAFKVVSAVKHMMPPVPCSPEDHSRTPHSLIFFPRGNIIS